MFDNLPKEIDQWMADMYGATPANQGHAEAVVNAMRFINDMDKRRGLDL